MTHITGFYTGTIDQFLHHCNSLDPEEVINDDPIHGEHLIEMYMKENNMTREEVIEWASQEAMKRELDQLVKDGVIEIVGYQEDGEPIYKAVE